MADWAKLHNDLLFEIGKHLTSIEDYDSYGAVCRSWRAAALRDMKHLKLKTLGSPLLMLSQKESSTSTNMREFFRVSTGKNREIFLPEATNKYCLSWKDWLFIFEEDGTHTSLLHLVSRFQIHLPNLNLLNNLQAYSLQSVVLSANPNSTSDFTVFILLQTQLYFYKPGNTSWTAIIDEFNHKAYSMIYLNDYMYTYGEEMVKYDVNVRNPIQLQHEFDPLPSGRLTREQILQHILGRLTREEITMHVVQYSCIVEFSNKCYIVHKYYYEDWTSVSHRTIRFEVYEENNEDGNSWWMEIHNLGNKAIFFGYNSLFVIECSDINKCKPNCIYFMDNPEYYPPVFGGDGQDSGIYDLSDGSVESLYHEKIECSKSGEPLWIGPSF